MSDHCVYLAMIQTELSASVQRNTSVHSALSTCSPPPQKKSRTSLFSHYSQQSAVGSAETVAHERQLQLYLDTINSSCCNREMTKLSDFLKKPEFSVLQHLFDRVFCSPASSAPVERVFSQSGLLMRPHRARMTDTMLENLVFLKCNGKM